jgi:hypothetical protein
MTPAGIDWALDYMKADYIGGSGCVRHLTWEAAPWFKKIFDAGMTYSPHRLSRLEGTNKHAVQVAANRMIRRGAFYHRTKIYDNVRAYGFGIPPDYSYSCFLDRDERRKA